MSRIFFFFFFFFWGGGGAGLGLLGETGMIVLLGNFEWGVLGAQLSTTDNCHMGYLCGSNCPQGVIVIGVFFFF